MKFSFVFMFTILPFFHSNLGYAQIGGDGKFGRVFEEADQNELDESEDEEDELDESGEDAETEDVLIPDSSELRKIHKRDVSVFMGQAMAWQSYGLSLGMQPDENSGTLFSVGKGSWDLKTHKEGLDYDLNLDTTGLFASYRHYPTEFGLFLQSSLGWLFWQGTMNPSGRSATNISEIVKSGVYANGPVLSANIGFRFSWQSGWIFEYSIVGFSRAALIYTNFTRSNSKTRTALKEKMQGFTNWGLFNFSIGKAI